MRNLQSVFQAHGREAVAKGEPSLLTQGLTFERRGAMQGRVMSLVMLASVGLVRSI